MRAILILLMCGLCIPLTLAAEAELVLDHPAGVVAAAWNPSETQILTAAQDGFVRVWAADDGELLLSIDHRGSPLTYARWDAAGATILSADESGLVLHSAASDGATLQSWQLDGAPVSLEFNRAETQVLAFTAAGRGTVLSLADGEVRLRVEHAGSISGAGWSADGTALRVWTEETDVVVWDAESGAETAAFSLPRRGMLLGMAWNQDDARVLAWYTDGNVYAYETDGLSVNSRALGSVRHRSFVQQALWSADEARVMSWAGDDTVHIWRADGGSSEQVLQHEDWVVGAAWDSEEARVLSWSHIYLYIWQAGTLQQRFRHQNLVRGAAWNRDGTQVLSWSWDGTARVWAAGG